MIVRIEIEVTSQGHVQKIEQQIVDYLTDDTPWLPGWIFKYAKIRKINIDKE